MRSLSESRVARYATVITVSWVLVAAAVSSPLITPDLQAITGEFVVYALVCFIAFYLGFFLFQFETPIRQIPASPRALKNWMFALLIIGVSCRALDRFILRPVGDISLISSVREARLEGSNVASVIGALAPAFGVVLLAMLATRHLNRLELLGARLIACVYLLDVLFTGSRGIVILIAILVFGIRVTLRSILILGPVIVLAFGAFYILRFSQITGNGDELGIIVQSSVFGYAYFVPASPGVLPGLSTDWGQIFLFPLVQLNQYSAHSIFEFAEVFRNAPSTSFAPGELIPQIPFLPRQEDDWFRAGVYYSLPGSLVLAFGTVWAPLASFFAGAWIGRTSRYADELGGGTRTIMIVVVFGVPFVNTIGGFDLVFYLLAISLFAHVAIERAESQIPQLSHQSLAISINSRSRLR